MMGADGDGAFNAYIHVNGRALDEADDAIRTATGIAAKDAGITRSRASRDAEGQRRHQRDADDRRLRRFDGSIPQSDAFIAQKLREAGASSLARRR